MGRRGGSARHALAPSFAAADSFAPGDLPRRYLPARPGPTAGARLLAGLAMSLTGDSARCPVRFNANPAPTATRRPRTTANCTIVCRLANADRASGATEGTPREGSRATSRAAIAVASGSDQRPDGIAAMIRASPSTAAVRGICARRAASCHGSMPRRARTDRTLSVIPLDSTPTSANRNLFKSERLNKLASVLATAQPHELYWYLAYIVLNEADRGKKLVITLRSWAFRCDPVQITASTGRIRWRTGGAAQ